MIDFEELKIPPSKVVDREQWNGMLDETRRYLEGNVGLGTDAPQAKLHIKGKEGAEVDLLVEGRIKSNNNVEIIGDLEISGNLKAGTGKGPAGKVLLTLNSERSWVFKQHSSGASTALKLTAGTASNNNKNFLIDIGGKAGVGIGPGVSSAEGHKLYVDGTLSLGSSLGKLKLALYQKGSSYYGMGVTAGHFYFNIGNPKARYVFLDSAGTGAKAIFTISGNGSIMAPNLRNIGNNRNMQYNSITGEIGYDNSTRRDKLNITPLTDDFGKILQLQPRKYTRPNDRKNWEIGYIAEEAKSLGLDNLVFFDENNHPDGINYRKLCLYLVEIVREHERKLNPNSPHLKKYLENEVPQPGLKSTKSKIKDYLDFHGVSYSAKDTKEELLGRIEIQMNKQK